MADLTANLDLTTDWLNVTAGLSLTDSMRYRFDAVAGDFMATVVVAETDDDVAPTLNGNPVMRLRERPRPVFVYRQRAGSRLWARSTHGDIRLSVLPILGT